MDILISRDVHRMHLPGQMSPEYRAKLLRARWRHKNGLEARALVALARAPAVLPMARELIRPDDFQTAAYLVAATFLLMTDPEDPKFEVIRDALDERPYLPELTPEEWEAEAIGLTRELVRRRERGAARRSQDPSRP